MSVQSLASGVPEAWRGHPGLYFLGIGGPETEEGIGRPETFVWRFVLLQLADGRDCALVFSSMPALMRLTRELNMREPFTLPTESLRLTPEEIGPGAPILAWLDPEPADLLALPRLSLRQQRIPELAP